MAGQNFESIESTSERIIIPTTSLGNIITIDDLPEKYTLSKQDWIAVFAYDTKRTGKASLETLESLFKADFYTKQEVVELLGLAGFNTNYAKLDTINNFTAQQVISYFNYLTRLDGANFSMQYQNQTTGDIYSARFRIDELNGKIVLDSDYGFTVPTPSAPQDAATKGYVDAQILYEEITVATAQDLAFSPDTAKFKTGRFYGLKDGPNSDPTGNRRVIIQALGPKTLNGKNAVLFESIVNQDGSNGDTYTLVTYNLSNDTYQSRDFNTNDLAYLSQANVFTQTQMVTDGTYSTIIGNNDVTIDSPGVGEVASLTSNSLTFNNNNNSTFANIQAAPSRDGTGTDLYLNGQHIKSLGAVEEPDDVVTKAYFDNNIPQVDESNLVHKDGTETITGSKTFSSPVKIASSGNNGLLVNIASGDAATPVAQFLSPCNTGAIFFAIGQNLAGSALFGYRAGTAFFTTYGRPLTDFTISNSSGNVGVGTDAATEKLTVAGNVKATQFLGDGSQLTGIPKTTITQFSAVTATANGAQTITVTGITGIINVQVMQPTGYVRQVWLGNLTVSTNTLTVSADANVKSGDQLIGTYYK